MPELTAGSTRPRFLPFVPPTGAYICFLRSVERLSGERNRSKYAQDPRSAAAWRHQFKFIVTHDAQGNALPHIGSASFAEFLTTSKAESNIVRLKAAINRTDPVNAGKISLPHSNNLIGLPFVLTFERKMGVNQQNSPFVASDISDIRGLSDDWINYLYGWLAQVGFEKKVLNGTEDQYLARPASSRAYELTDQELYQAGYNDQYVLGAIQHQRQFVLTQSQRQPQQGYNQPAPTQPAGGGYAMGGYAAPPAAQSGGYATPPAHHRAPVQQQPHAQPPPHAYAQPPAAAAPPLQAQPPQPQPPAQATPHPNGMMPPPPGAAPGPALPPQAAPPTVNGAPPPHPNVGGPQMGHVMPPAVTPPPAGMTFPSEVAPLTTGASYDAQLPNEIPF